MKYWKKILIAAAAVIFILMVAVYAFLSLYDFNKFKPKIATLLREKIGRELTIDGDIKVNFGLTPSVVVEDLRLENAAGLGRYLNQPLPVHGPFSVSGRLTDPKS